MLIMNIYQRFKFISELTGEIDPKNEQSKKEKLPVINSVLGISGLLDFFSILLWFSENSNSLSN